MKSELRSFIGGAFALIALYLIVANSGGFSTAITSGTTGASKVFATLQGRAT